MTEQALIDLLLGGGAHGLMIVIIIVLWRENRRLTDKIEATRQTVASVHALTLANHAAIADMTSDKYDAAGNLIPERHNTPRE